MNNIIEFPQTDDENLQRAIKVFGCDTADVALAEFKKLIDQGYDEAFSFAGNLYECGGKNVERDYAKARFYYEQSVERVGAIAAYLGLIRIYYYGRGVERDCSKALEYCSIVVEETDHPHANFYIGKMYMDGCGVNQDLEKSKVFFKKAWNQGYVFGLTYLGIAEQKTGHNMRGWLYRIKAGILAFKIAKNNINDARIREL